MTSIRPATEDEIFLAKMKEHMLRVRATISETKQELRDNERGYHERKAAIEEKLRAIRLRCPHVSKEYHPDPSGNNGSWYECRDCGATL